MLLDIRSSVALTDVPSSVIVTINSYISDIPTLEDVRLVLTTSSDEELIESFIHSIVTIDGSGFSGFVDDCLIRPIASLKSIVSDESLHVRDIVSLLDKNQQLTSGSFILQSTSNRYDVAEYMILRHQKNPWSSISLSIEGEHYSFFSKNADYSNCITALHLRENRVVDEYIISTRSLRVASVDAHNKHYNTNIDDRVIYPTHGNILDRFKNLRMVDVSSVDEGRRMMASHPEIQRYGLYSMSRQDVHTLGVTKNMVCIQGSEFYCCYYEGVWYDALTPDSERVVVFSGEGTVIIHSPLYERYISLLRYLPSTKRIVYMSNVDSTITPPNGITLIRVDGISSIG